MKKKFNFKSLFTGLKWQGGLFAAVSILAAIAIVIVVNLAVGLIPTSATRKDMSSEKLYTVSDTSRDLLNGLDANVEIAVLAPTDGVDQRISTYLELYCSLSDKLTLKNVDTTLYPSALSEYGVDSSNVVVVRNTDTGKQQAIAFGDILVLDMYSYYYYGQTSYTEFDAEGQLTSAINLVTTDAAHTVYCDTGHGEAALGSEISEMIEKNNLTTQDVNLLTDGGVPEDCELLLFNQPTSDLSADELEQVDHFLTQRGPGDGDPLLGDHPHRLPQPEQPDHLLRHQHSGGRPGGSGQLLPVFRLRLYLLPGGQLLRFHHLRPQRRQLCDGGL